jgi:hypothetical protein
MLPSGMRSTPERVPAFATRAITGSVGLSCALGLGACGASSAPAEPAADHGAADPDGAPGSSGRLDPDGSLADDDAGSPGAPGLAALDGGAEAPDASPSARDAGASGITDAGVPYKGVANSACADLGRLGVSWYYNWTLSAGSCTSSPFVPMIWGHTGKEQTAAGIASEMAGLVSGGYRTVLGFNEPDNASQSNLSATTALALWPSLASDASVRLGSPATQANTTGQAWFTSFMQKVNADTTGTLRVDFIAAHWYGWNAGSCDAKAAGLESYVKWLEAIPGNRPIWLTEWGCLNQSNPTPAVVQAFFSGAVAMFARHPRLERYAWYPWTTNNDLVDPDGGSLTPLGVAFAAAPSYR